MTSAALRLSRVSAIAAMFAVAAPASAGGPAFLKFGGVEGQTAAHKDHKGEIEILSYSWGSSNAGAGKDMTLKGKTIGQNSKDGAKGGNVEFEWKVEEGESAPPRPGGVRVAAGDIDGDRRASVGASKTETVGANRSHDTASGQATGKRQHMPLRTRMYYDQPQAKGSVWVRVSSPWRACRVGTRYPSLQLNEGTKSYVLQDVTVGSCGRSGDADDRPTEEVAFYYSRIAFN